MQQRVSFHSRPAADLARLHRHERAQWLLCTMCKLITIITTLVFKVGNLDTVYGRTDRVDPTSGMWSDLCLIVSRSVWPGQTKALLNRN